MTWHAYIHCSTVDISIQPPSHPSCACTCSVSAAQWTPSFTHPVTPAVLVPALFLQTGSSNTPRATRACLLGCSVCTAGKESAGSPSKRQSQQAFAHVCLTFPLLFQNKVLKQQGKGSVKVAQAFLETTNRVVFSCVHAAVINGST